MKKKCTRRRYIRYVALMFRNVGRGKAEFFIVIVFNINYLLGVVESNIIHLLDNVESNIGFILSRRKYWSRAIARDQYFWPRQNKSNVGRRGVQINVLLYPNEVQPFTIHLI